jgi:hypothetical protein
MKLVMRLPSLLFNTNTSEDWPLRDSVMNTKMNMIIPDFMKAKVGMVYSPQ